MYPWQSRFNKLNTEYEFDKASQSQNPTAGVTGKAHTRLPVRTSSTADNPSTSLVRNIHRQPSRKVARGSITHKHVTELIYLHFFVLSYFLVCYNIVGAPQCQKQQRATFQQVLYKMIGRGAAAGITLQNTMSTRLAYTRTTQTPTGRSRGERRGW